MSTNTVGDDVLDAFRSLTDENTGKRPPVEVREWLDRCMLDDEMVTAVPHSVSERGVVVDVEGVKGLIPWNHVGDVDSEAEDFRDPIDVFVLDRKKRDNGTPAYLFSRWGAVRELTKDDRQRFLGRLKRGDVVEGTVSHVESYGVFVEVLPCFDAFIHVSEIEWCYVAEPFSYLQVGQKVAAKAVEIDVRAERVRLSLKRMKEDPWKRAGETHPVGSAHVGEVVRKDRNGAFVRLPGKIDALVHRKVIAASDMPADAFDVGAKLDVEVTHLDVGGRRMAAKPI
ncbi:hypothetical protein CKO28_17430 [Rhodovibrio sodomensis]|uniref:S1 motif domain-containing protein n=1 Tax=Rhodovibrio sodomensis TaxID=1088 RepID=A0ABS1DH76_9PROT|nr:S1 RNA-binding domain-containing protein [Rhodovibrio sodomensis]MBK1669820.1 hypothetical protein [Rhodovibrio sodomensis]